GRFECPVFLGLDTVAFGFSDQAYGFSTTPMLYRGDLKSPEVVRITIGDTPALLRSVVLSDARLGARVGMIEDAGTLILPGTREFDSGLYRAAAPALGPADEWTVTHLTRGVGSVDSFDARNGRVVFVGMRGPNLPELFELRDGIEHRLTSFNEWVAAECRVVEPRFLSVSRGSGMSVEGWVLIPEGIASMPGSCPGILNIHGGPKTAYGEVFFHEMQTWAARGYAVIYCNPRGSAGKGDAFADIRGRYGTIDYDDIMAFLDAALQRFPEIDSGRLGVTGGSYGGFMTNWMIGHTDRFKAAASQRSISNWTAFWGTSDIGYWFADDQMAATPWSEPDKYAFHSPLSYADAVTTPTLFIHSDSDYRCWIQDGLQMFTALKYHGVPSRFAWFEGENHELSRTGKPQARICRLKEIISWFDTYL
ncbi:MAG: S9 family peptidase, partial [Spirochaetales bacterium]